MWAYDNNEVKTDDADEVDDWDSLGHIRLIVAVECHFKIKFTSAEISGWANVGEFVNAIKTKLG